MPTTDPQRGEGWAGIFRPIPRLATAAAVSTVAAWCAAMVYLSLAVPVIG